MVDRLKPVLSNDNDGDPYEFDLDQFGAPLLNGKNVRFLHALIKHDSRYGDSQARDDSIEKITKKLLQSKEGKPDRDSIEQAVKLINGVNSTHLQSEGPQGGNKGLERTVDAISSIEGLIGRIERGGYSFIDTIANAGGKNNFSFATKFCTHLNIWCFGNENGFVVFDKVLERILPYYAYMYASDKAFTDYREILVTRSGGIRKSIAMERNSNGYKNYCAIVQDIRNQVNADKSKKLTCRDIEQLIWYYFRRQDKMMNGLDNAWNTIRV